MKVPEDYSGTRHSSIRKPFPHPLQFCGYFLKSLCFFLHADSLWSDTRNFNKKMAQKTLEPGKEEGSMRGGGWCRYMKNYLIFLHSEYFKKIIQNLYEKAHTFIGFWRTGDRTLHPVCGHDQHFFSTSFQIHAIQVKRTLTSKRVQFV